MTREANIKQIGEERQLLEDNLNTLIKDRIQYIPIASTELMPYGWRKSAKERTVWRIVGEVISQNILYAYENSFVPTLFLFYD